MFVAEKTYKTDGEPLAVEVGMKIGDMHLDGDGGIADGGVCPNIRDC